MFLFKGKRNPSKVGLHYTCLSRKKMTLWQYSVYCNPINLSTLIQWDTFCTQIRLLSMLTQTLIQIVTLMLMDYCCTAPRSPVPKTPYNFTDLVPSFGAYLSGKEWCFRDRHEKLTIHENQCDLDSRDQSKHCRSTSSSLRQTSNNLLKWMRFE